MKVFSSMEYRNHEQVVFLNHPESGLKGIIAIHNTVLGPALGGTRMCPYESEEAALEDVLRLSRGMTYKAAAAGLNLGGGKAVIIGNPKTDLNEKMLRAFGRFVQGLGGRYITAEDVGTSVKDMERVRIETDYVTGIDETLGGSGDPSSVTAIGTLYGIKAAAAKLWGNNSLTGKKIAVQGLGHVGYHLVKYLYDEEADLIVTDIDDEAVKRIVDEFKVTVVDPDEIYAVDADIFAPCALGGIINDETIPQFKVKIIAGAANNQLLAEERHAEILRQKKILYAPDYVINAGGLINVANELDGYNRERALKQAMGIYDVILKIFENAEKENISTHQAANQIAEKRIKDVEEISRIYTRKYLFPKNIGRISV
ncbi:MAG: leucine dehydrogenase [Chloroflexi bacterium]|nr:MAG: leucine dehydrogenase [Chloroflexota bacterium]